jgi:ribosomal protein S18 acetylase RimI-like enzyme
MVIGPLPPHRQDAAVALWHATGLTRPWNDPVDDLRRALDGPSSAVLAALDEAGELLGTAMVGHDGHRGWVYYLAVDPDARRQGLGRELMRACEHWLRARDVPKLQLMVRSGNRGAVAFYQRLGYTDADVVVLGRRLDG